MPYTLRLDDSKIIESEEVSPGIVLDYNESNQVVAIEVLGLSTSDHRIWIFPPWNSGQTDTPL